MLIVTKFRLYPLCVSVYYYVYPQIFRVHNYTILSNTQHYAVCVRTIGSCMPSRRLRRLDAPLVTYMLCNGTSLQSIDYNHVSRRMEPDRVSPQRSPLPRLSILSSCRFGLFTPEDRCMTSFESDPLTIPSGIVNFEGGLSSVNGLPVYKYMILYYAERGSDG